MKPIKILFITQWLEMYGATISITNLLLDLKKRYNIEAYVIIPKKDIPYNFKTIDEVLDENEIPYCKMNMDTWRTRFPGQNKSHILYYKLRKIYRNCKFISDYKKRVPFMPDIIYSNSSVIDVGIWLALSLHKPHIWHIRESGRSYNLQYIFPLSIVRKFFDKSDAVIAVSRYIQEECRQMKIKCTSQIYNGIGICPAYKKVYYNCQIVNFAVTGNFIHIKRQLDVIKAAEILVSKGYKNFNIYLLGDGEDREILKNEVMHYKLDDCINFCGFVRNTQDILRKMDVGITATSYEAFGLATVEYMMNYMPVIGNDSGATREIIENRGCGYLYHLGNIDELADCMEKFLCMSKEIEEMGRIARKEAERYSIENNTNSLYYEVKKILET